MVCSMFLYKNRGRDWIHWKNDLLHTPYFVCTYSLYALATNKGHVSSPVHLFYIIHFTLQLDYTVACSGRKKLEQKCYRYAYCIFIRTHI